MPDGDGEDFDRAGFRTIWRPVRDGALLSIPCSHCGQTIELPREEPWLITPDGEEIPPGMLESMRCPQCGNDVIVTPRDAPRRPQ